MPESNGIKRTLQYVVGVLIAGAVAAVAASYVLTRGNEKDITALKSTLQIQTEFSAQERKEIDRDTMANTKAIQVLKTQLAVIRERQRTQGMALNLIQEALSIPASRRVDAASPPVEP